MNLFTKQKQTYRNKKQPQVTIGERGGGINQEFGVNIHTTIYKTDRQPHPPEGRQQKQGELQSCSLWKKKPHSQKDRQDEKAEGYVPDETTR